MPSKITIEFIGVPDDGTILTLRSDLTSPNDLKETFKPVRTSNYQSEVSAPLLYNAAEGYFWAINADYNTGGLFTVVRVSSYRVSIEHPESGFFTLGNIVDTTTSDISVVIDDTPDTVPINITDVSFSEAVAPCADVQLDITTDVLAVFYGINTEATTPNVLNPFNFELLRGAYINLEVENAEGERSNIDIQVPQSLSAENTEIGIVNSPSGATLTVSVSNSNGLELEYSLNNVDWQTSNVFSGILEGSYTMYVRDQLGCDIEKPFDVPAFSGGGVGSQSPYADLPSKSNSIRFAKHVDWGICSNYKNEENTLSCDLPYTQNTRMALQLFQSCDIITTQIRSNYESIVVTIVEADGTETLVPVDKKSDNIGLEDKRDSIKYNLGGLGSQTGIYFTSGNTYDYTTDAVTGTYALNGGLPSWGYIGNFVFLDGAWFEIVDIIYDDTKSAEILVINAVYTGVEVSVVSSSLYNLFDYEVYEFTIDMGVYNNKEIQINIAETDARDGFDDVVFLSEIIDIRTVQEDTIEILYYNDTNTDIFYATGIRNKIRMPIEYMVGGVSDDTSAEKTDTSVYLLNAENYETDEVAFQLMTKQFMRKTIQALSHKFVFLNEVSYVKEDSPDITPLIGTNLYRVTAKMTKSESVYTSEGIGETFSVGTLEIPNLLEIESDGYLKIKE